MFYEDKNEEKKGLELKDIVYWEENGKWSEKLMVTQFSGGSFGLINIDLGILKQIQFPTIKELEYYLLNKSVERNEIVVLSSEDWLVYVP